MSRTITSSEEDARSELSPDLTKPNWLACEHILPFDKLTGDEFEILCFLLLREMHPHDSVFYYGKTADQGRDIIHRKTGGPCRLIQCKNFKDAISPSHVAAEIAKVIANVHSGKIPEKPDEVVFFVSSDLSSLSQDLIDSQEMWIERAHGELKKLLRKDPSEELMDFARSWWPFEDRQIGISITEDIRKFHPKLIEEFFTVRTVISARREDVRQDLEEVANDIVERLSIVERERDRDVVRDLPYDIPLDKIRNEFRTASKSLLNWPQTLGDSIWIDRTESDSLLDLIRESPKLNCVLLGEPGSGKSAFLANLGTRLEELGISCLGIKADMLDVSVTTLGKLAERLHLPGKVEDCVAVLSQHEKVVVLIDQLDALGDLVDVRSERLNVLLGLINQLASIANVYVISSSRTFEFHHDSRFRSIDAQEIQFQLPEWDKVDEILSQQNILSSQWPTGFREILRSPQNLKVFVEQLSGTTEQRIYDSYQQMLEDLWYRRIVNSPDVQEKTVLLSSVAKDMSDSEVLWLPLARYDSDRDTIDQLVADGFLKLSDNRLKFGFQHQTIFSHARARAVVQGDVDLVEFVKDRQHALFVRPVLWSILGYLREASRQSYMEQMTLLCSQRLKLHIQHLLIDFLGRLNDPENEEGLWLATWLIKDDFTRRTIQAISGSKVWFERLKDSHLSDLMLNSKGIEWNLVSLLSNSITHSPNETIELLREFWLKDDSMDHFSLRVLQFLSEWSSERVSLVCALIARTAFSETAVTQLASDISEDLPELAPKVIATELRRNLSAQLAARDSSEKVLPQNATIEERFSAAVGDRSRNRFRSLIEAYSGRQELPEIAMAAPVEYLNEIWPLFLETLEPLLDNRNTVYWRFTTSISLYFDSTGKQHRENNFFKAIMVALRELEQKDPTGFEVFVRNEMKSESLIVQRIICNSLIESIETQSRLALEFLTTDSRRLAIGDTSDSHCDSRRLIRAISPLLSGESLRHLIDAIEGWTDYPHSMPDEEPELRRKRRKWDRESRQLLRLAIPGSCVTDDLRTRIESERHSLPHLCETPELLDSEMAQSMGTSPMSAKQMEKATNSQIIKLFDQFDKDTEWDHPRYGYGSGARAAASEFAAFSRDDPERGAQIATQLRYPDHEIPVCHLIGVLGTSDYSSTKLFALIQELVEHGFGSPEFRDTVAVACGNKAIELNGLPDDICELLKDWLDNWKCGSQEVDNEIELTDTDEEKKRSILFDLGDRYTIPHGSFSLLRTITLGLMYRSSPEADAWIEVLERHLDRPEKLRTWQALWRQLFFLRNCEKNRAIEFLTLLFDRFPTVRDSRFGVFILVKLRLFVGEEYFVKFCNQIASSGWIMGQQAKGELFAVSFLLEDGYESVRDFIEEATRSDSRVSEEIRRGIAFSTANLWKEGVCRKNATNLFVSISKCDSPKVHSALSEVFLYEQFVPNRHSMIILEATIERLGIIGDVDAARFAEMLELFVGVEPRLTLVLANALLDQMEGNRNDEYQRNFDLSDAALTSIAVTIQRMPMPLRADGLDLFERLLRLGFSATVQTVNDLDNRPHGVPMVTRRKRRRKS